MIGPVVFCVVTLGIASMDSLRKAGRWIGVKARYFSALAGVDADRWPSPTSSNPAPA
jgi:Na+/H+-dicarboxylate symporter